MNIIEPVIDKEKFIRDVYPKMCPGQQYIPAILPAVKRLLVFGDLHGDYNLFLQMINISGIAKVSDTPNVADGVTWTGGSTYVVQIGDQIDRCRPINNMLCSNPITTQQDEASDVKIMLLANELHNKASKHGGAFISLLGNHEIMNSTGFLQYVSHLGLKQFENYVDPSNPIIKFKSGEDARKHAFKPGNEIGKMMGCNRLPAVVIGDHIMVHAGIVDGLINELGLSGMDDLESINIAMRMWLLGLLKQKYVKRIIKSSNISMFWTRILGNIPPNMSLSNPACVQHIGKVLKLFKIGSIIVGHTPQSFTYSDDINQTCSGKVWRVDNGSSAAFNRFDRDLMTSGKIKYSRRAQVLEIIDNNKYYIIDSTGRKEVSVDK